MHPEATFLPGPGHHQKVVAKVVRGGVIEEMLTESEAGRVKPALSLVTAEHETPGHLDAAELHRTLVIFTCPLGRQEVVSSQLWPRKGWAVVHRVIRGNEVRSQFLCPAQARLILRATPL